MSTNDSSWLEVLDLNLTPLDQLRAVNVNGEDLLIFRHGDRYVAMDRWCPHQNADMAEGRIVGRALKCPLHGFMFSLDSGRGLNCPGFNVRVHDVQVENGCLRVRLKE